MSSISRASAKLDFPLPVPPHHQGQPRSWRDLQRGGRSNAAEPGNRHGAQIGSNRLARRRPGGRATGIPMRRIGVQLLVSSKPALIRPRVNPEAAPGEIDRQVAELVGGESIYAVDAALLEQLEADLIVTQDLCHVCAASPEDLAAALARMPDAKRPRVLTFTPRTLADVWRGVREIGEAAGRAQAAHSLAEKLERQVAGVAAAVDSAPERPRVLCLEWFDPPYYAGHWVPEMVRLAGGVDVLGREGEPSLPVTWANVLASKPDVVVLMSCGYSAARNLETWAQTHPPSGWDDLPAARNGRVYAVNANVYFARSGPRLAEGVALLAGLLHRERVPLFWYGTFFTGRGEASRCCSGALVSPGH